MNAEEHLRRVQWQAFNMLSELELLAEEYWDEGRGARWVIGTAGTFTNRCEIIAGIGGSLVFHGDFDVCRFAHYSDHPDAFRRLCWMGRCYDVGYYVAQKASIGTHGKLSVEVYDEDVAKTEIADYLKETDCKRTRRVLKAALAEHTEDKRTLQEFIWRSDFLDLPDFGMVLAPHVVVAHTALNKCASLLLEKYGGAPPACRGDGDQDAL